MANSSGYDEKHYNSTNVLIKPKYMPFIRYVNSVQSGQCMYINDKKYSELRDIFDKLSAGADQALLDDLQDLPFGSYGHLADK